MRILADVEQSRAVFEGIDISPSHFDASDLMAVLESLNLTDDPDLLLRAGGSTSLRITGSGTIDFGTRELDLEGGMHLSDGAVLPLMIGGTLDEPRIALHAGQ